MVAFLIYWNPLMYDDGDASPVLSRLQSWWSVLGVEESGVLTSSHVTRSFMAGGNYFLFSPFHRMIIVWWVFHQICFYYILSPRYDHFVKWWNSWSDWRPLMYDNGEATPVLRHLQSWWCVRCVEESGVLTSSDVVQVSSSLMITFLLHAIFPESS